LRHVLANARRLRRANCGLRVRRDRGVDLEIKIAGRKRFNYKLPGARSAKVYRVPVYNRDGGQDVIGSRAHADGVADDCRIFGALAGRNRYAVCHAGNGNARRVRVAKRPKALNVNGKIGEFLKRDEANRKRGARCGRDRAVEIPNPDIKIKVIVGDVFDAACAGRHVRRRASRAKLIHKEAFAARQFVVNDGSGRSGRVDRGRRVARRPAAPLRIPSYVRSRYAGKQVADVAMAEQRKRAASRHGPASDGERDRRARHDGRNSVAARNASRARDAAKIDELPDALGRERMAGNRNRYAGRAVDRVRQARANEVRKQDREVVVRDALRRDDTEFQAHRTAPRDSRARQEFGVRAGARDDVKRACRLVIRYAGADDGRDEIGRKNRRAAVGKGYVPNLLTDGAHGLAGGRVIKWARGEVRNLSINGGKRGLRSGTCWKR